MRLRAGIRGLLSWPGALAKRPKPGARRSRWRQDKAREEEVERINARTIEDDLKEASLEELDELEDELEDDSMLEKYRAQVRRAWRRLPAAMLDPDALAEGGPLVVLVDPGTESCPASDSDPDPESGPFPDETESSRRKQAFRGAGSES